MPPRAYPPGCPAGAIIVVFRPRSQSKSFMDCRVSQSGGGAGFLAGSKCSCAYFLYSDGVSFCGIGDAVRIPSALKAARIDRARPSGLASQAALNLIRALVSLA